MIRGALAIAKRFAQSLTMLALGENNMSEDGTRGLALYLPLSH